MPPVAPSDPLGRPSVADVPAAAAPPADVLALEEVAALGWRTPDAEWLGRWLLRAAQGWTGRGNSVLPLGEPGLPLDAALERVLGWYAERGLPARFQVPLPAREDLDAALEQRGWAAYNPTRVLVADLPAAPTPGRVLGSAAPELPPVLLEAAPSAQWLGAYHYRGGSRLPDVAAGVLAAGDQPVFASVRTDDGTVMAIARAVVDRGWAGVTAVEVGPAYRRRGLAAHVMRALSGWAVERGARWMWLQVAEENTAALALYRRLGFTVHHRYHYRLAGDAVGSRFAAAEGAPG